MHVGLPHPENIRRAIVRAFYEKGLTYAQIADLLGIGTASVSRTLRLYRESGDVQPRPRGPGRSSPIEGKVAEELRRIVVEQPDGTLSEFLQTLVERTGIITSRSAVSRAVHRLGFSRKKRSSWRLSATPRRTRHGA